MKEINNILFGTKKEIPILNNTKTTNTYGRPGVVCSLNPNNKAKFSACALALENLVNGNTNALIDGVNGDDVMLYGEMMKGGEPVSFVLARNTPTKTYRIVFYSDEEDCMTEIDALSCIILETVACCSKELKDCFKRIANDYSKGKDVSEDDVLVFCDAFYYEVASEGYSFDVRYNPAEKVSTFNETIAIYKEIKEFKGIPKNSFKNVSRETDVSADSVENARNDDEETLYERVKSGEFIISYDWPDEVKGRIPDIAGLEDYVPNEAFYSIMFKIYDKFNKCILRMDAGLTGVSAIKQDFVNLMCVGRPGTGKTTLAYAVAQALQIPIFTVAITKNTEEDTFQGMTKVVDGNFQFVSTDFLNAYTYGGLIVCEEINLADPAVIMGAIGQAIEYPFILEKNGYVPVTRNPLCAVMGTENIRTYGAKGVNQALSSRFKQTYELDDPTSEDFVNILIKQGYDRKASKWVYLVYDKIVRYLRDTMHDEDACLSVTLRGCIGALENMSEGESPKLAVKNSLIGKIAETDLELAQTVYDAVVEPIPDSY